MVARKKGPAKTGHVGAPGPQPARPPDRAEPKVIVRQREALPPKPDRPRVRMSYGWSHCLFCKRPFERSRPWSKFDTEYCRTSYFHHTHRRVTEPGQIVEVDGKTLATPQPVVDPELVHRVEVETQGAMKEPAKR